MQRSGDTSACFTAAALLMTCSLTAKVTWDSVPSTPNTHRSPGTASWTVERGRTWRTSPLVSVFHWRNHFSAKTERTSCFLCCNLQTRGVSDSGTNCAFLPQQAPVWRQRSWSSAANQQPSVKLTCGHELPIAVFLAQLSSISTSCWMSFKHNFQRRVTCVVVGRERAWVTSESTNEGEEFSGTEVCGGSVIVTSSTFTAHTVPQWR